MSEYYRKGSIEVKDFIYDQQLDFAEGCVVKYVCRYKEKDGYKDLIKARDYLQDLINRELGNDPESKETYKESRIKVGSIPVFKRQQGLAGYFNNLDTD